MSYNSTIDINSLDLYNNFKYDKNPLYEYTLRNIKYLPYDTLNRIDDSLVDNFNAMIVRKDTNYYGMSRSKLNYPMEHSNVLQTYRNELQDYLNLYSKWIDVLDTIPSNQYDSLIENYKYMLFNFTIPEIIRLNNIINLQISITDDLPKINIKYNLNLFTLFIGIIIIFIILFIITKNNYYK
jgi:hypothetical protein